MIKTFYAHGIDDIIHGNINWVSDSIKAVLVDTSLYTLDRVAHQYLSSIPVGARIATSSVLTGKTLVGNVADANDIALSSVTGTIGAIVLFTDTGNASTSKLIFYLDYGLPLSRTNESFVITWDNGASKIFQYDPTVVVLLHGDDLSGSGFFFDEAGKIWGSSAPQLDTVNKKFGAGSIKQLGVGINDSHLQTLTTPDIYFGTGDFTIDLWMRTTNTTGAILDNLDSYNSYNSSSVDFWQNGVNVSWLPVYDGSHTINSSGATTNDGNWHHVALVRYGSVFTIYIDGQDRGHASYSGLNVIYSGGAVYLYLGRDGASSWFWKGNIDELRIVKGIAKWTSAFTPPTIPYTPNIVGSPSYSPPGIFSLPFVPPATLGSIVHLLDDFEVGTLDYANVTKPLPYSWEINVIDGKGSKEGIDEAARFVFRPEGRIKLFPGPDSTEEPAEETASEWMP